MDRRQFVQKSMLLLAFASTYTYAKSSNAFLSTPSKKIDLFFTKVKELGVGYLHDNIADDEWRMKLNELYVQLFRDDHRIEDLRKYIDFNQLKKCIDYKEKGRGRVIVDTPLSFKNEKLVLKTQVIGVLKGYAIPPHVHENMASSSLILSGRMLVSHYNRLESYDDYIIVEKDHEHYQKEGDWSMVSPIKNNLHWFRSFDTDSFMLNINIEGLNHEKAKPGIRVDINQPDDSENRFKATFISDSEAQIKYGKLK